MRTATLLLSLALLAACREQPTPSQRGDREQAAATPAQAVPRAIDRQFAGQAAPDIALETGPDGATETLADIARANPGKKLLVNLWATWCAPCLVELPTLDALAANSRDTLVVIPVSQDMEGWRKVSPAFTREKYPNLETRLESQMQLGLALKATGLPLTILYDENSREIWRYAGDRDWNSASSRADIGLAG